jgi:sugar/nucleoside kinase (ribokinase family)
MAERSPGHLLVVGDVVDDVLVRPLGPTAVASDTAAQIEQQPGGSAANVAAWAGRAGAPVAFVGRAGPDGVRRHTEALAAHGVDAALVPDPRRRTAAIVLLVDPAGERTMYVDRGANAGLSAADVPDRLWQGAGWLHLTGYSFFCPDSRPGALGLLARARAEGVRVSVDPSSVGFLQEADGAFLDWVAGADLLVPNADEVRLLTGVDDPVAAATALLDRIPEVVVTCGAQGAVRVARDAEPLHQAAPAAEVVDTTGAGDAFCAGLLAARTRGEPVAGQLADGAALAARCVVRLGARPT